jgi:hypothetical protein
MTQCSIIKHTYYNNNGGVLNYTMSFGLKEKIESNCRLYFYKYDLHRVVEIEYKDDIIFISTFQKEEDLEFIKNNLEFYAGYFKSAGLQNNKFLFDTCLKMPVSYEDFIEMDQLPHITSNEYLLVLDKKSGYVIGKSNAILYVTTDKTANVDKCILAFLNDLINVSDPRVVELAGTMSGCIISGLLSGVGINGTKFEIENCDPDYKFVKSFNGIDMSESNIVKIKSKLKINKFDKIIKGLKKKDVIDGEIIKSPPEKGQVNLRDLIETGVDRFIKMFDSQEISWKVTIDVPMMQNMIRSAHIWKGVLYINPLVMNADVKYFREFLDSDNIELVLN